AYFLDHPGLKANCPEASVGSNTSVKAKVHSQKCFHSDLVTLKLQDDKDVHCDRQVHYHTESELMDCLWATDKTADRGWCCAAPTTLLGHL
ncbi:hypothetical protein PAXRUDRAFT_139726, partial [Paxillus rubicundulus Ve08.2h10]